MKKLVDLRMLANMYGTDELDTFLSIVDIQLKTREPSTISRFVQCFPSECKLDGFLLDYTIPQIGNEFDLLRKSGDFILNIELKSENVGIHRITEQLKKQRRYLRGTKISRFSTYCFVVNKGSQDILYKMSDDERLVQVEFSELAQEINVHYENINWDNLFNPKQYLVSPFNDTERFLEQKYFLTEQQTLINDEIMECLNNGVTKYVVMGGAGTGKSLLLYFMATEIKKLWPNRELLIIHPGRLNTGHTKLKRHVNVQAKNKVNIQVLCQKNKDSIILIDESQRLTNYQFNELVKLDMSLILFGDTVQSLSDSDMGELMTASEHLKQFNVCKLEDTIRTNAELATFIKMLGWKFWTGDKNKELTFDKDFSVNQHKNNTSIVSPITGTKITIKNSKMLVPEDISVYELQGVKSINFENIDIKYFVSDEEAVEYFRNMSDDYQKIIPTPTGSNFLNRAKNKKVEKLLMDLLDIPGSMSAHSAIGQEFDNVITVIPSNISYSTNGKWTCEENVKTYYPIAKGVYQSLTRARTKLMIVVVDNPVMLKRINEIVNSTS